MHERASGGRRPPAGCVGNSAPLQEQILDLITESARAIPY